MKRIVRSSRDIVHHYAQDPDEQLGSMLGISSYYGSDSLLSISEGKWNYKIASRYSRLDANSSYIPKLKKIGAKYITVRYGSIYFYYDKTALVDNYKSETQRLDDEYYGQLDSFDVSKYKPADAIIKKLMDYRAAGSMVNVKAIKDLNKLFTYYYGAKMIGWSDLAYAIEHDSSFHMFDYEDELNAITRQVKAEESYADTRSEMEKKLGLGDSHGLFTFEGTSCWVPKSILQFFIKNNVPVHFGKRTSGARYDHNGAQWSEVEHLTLFPDDDPIQYDIVVHTNERADNSIPTTFTAVGRTEDRVSAKKIIEDLQYIVSRHKS